MTGLRSAIGDSHAGVDMYGRGLTIQSLRYRQVVDAERVENLLQLLRAGRNRPLLLTQHLDTLKRQAFGQPAGQMNRNTRQRAGLLGSRNAPRRTRGLQDMYLLAEQP